MAKLSKKPKTSKITSGKKAARPTRSVPETARDERIFSSVPEAKSRTEEKSIFATDVQHSMQKGDYDGELYADYSGGLVGWVQSNKAKNKAVEVELTIGGKVVASTLANRTDIGLGDGRSDHEKHGFLLRMESWPELPMPQQLTVRVKGGDYVIGSIQVRTNEDLAGLAEHAYAGMIDGVVEGRVRGWCCDLANPTEELSVDVFDNGAFLANIPSGEFRRDLLNAKLAGGYCGFQFALPLSFLDGLMHTVTICFAGTNRVLPNGTFFFGISNESQLTKYVASLIGQVQSFHRQIADMEKALLDRHEALMVIQRENIERELQVLRNLVLSQDKKASMYSVKPPVSAG